MHAHRQRNGTQRTQNRIGIAGQSESTTRKRSEKVAETSGTKERRDTTKNGTRKKATRITAEEKLKTTRKPERREIKTERERERGEKKTKETKRIPRPPGHVVLICIRPPVCLALRACYRPDFLCNLNKFGPDVFMDSSARFQTLQRCHQRNFLQTLVSLSLSITIVAIAFT